MILLAQDFMELKDSTKDVLLKAKNNVINADCLDILPLLPDESIDLIHTSPPYNIDKRYHGPVNDNLPTGTFLQFLSKVIEECKRVLKPNGSIFWQTGYTQSASGIPGDIEPIDMLTDKLFRASPHSMALWDRIIWYYYGGMAFKKKFTNRHQTILWYVKPCDGTANPKFDVDAIREKAREYDRRNNLWGRNPGNVWEADRMAFGSVEQSNHIAVFPESITEKIVRACSQPGDIILDPFLGSGTVAKVARSLGRQWVGIEISSDYCLQANRRLGYTQPSEFFALVSGLIKTKVFAQRRATLPISEVQRRLSLYLHQIENIQEDVLHFNKTIASILGQDSPQKLAKRNAWAYYDKVIDEGDINNPVVYVDRILADCYKNRSNLNGIFKYRTALALLQRLDVFAKDPTNSLDELIRNVAREEPSTYKLEGDLLTLLVIERRLVETENQDFEDQPANITAETDEDTQPTENDGPPLFIEFQHRLPI